MNFEYLEEFKKDRDTMLSNLENINYEEIDNFCKKYKIPILEDSIAMLAGLHKARLYVTTMNTELIEKSKAWLKEHGFSENIE